MSLLLENFAAALTTVEAVDRLNTRILQWAMQGKLVPQDPDDEPTHILLERIKAEKEQLIKEGKSKENDVLPSIREIELPYELPKSWEWVYLEDIAEILMGQSPPGKSYNSDGDGVPLINGPVEFGGGGPFSITIKSKFTTSPTKMCKEGDLLVCVRGSTTGRTNIAGFDACIGRGVAAIQAYCYRKYLNLFVLSYREQFYNRGTGSTFPSVSYDKIRNISVPLPPLDEQKRIAEKIESLFDQTRVIKEQLLLAQEKNRQLNQAALHHLLAANTPEEFQSRWAFIRDNFELLYNTPENVGELKQAILQLAVQGKLVRQEAGDEPASVLLERIRREKEGKGRKGEALPPIREEEKPYELPEGWEWVRVGQIASAIDYGTSQKADDIGEVPMLRMGNIVDGEIVYNNLKYLPEEINDLPRLYLQSNDLLFNRTNSYELVGKTGIFREQSNKYTFASYLIRVSLIQSLTCSEYVNIYFDTKVCRETQIEPEITQQTGQANFNGTKLKNILVPFPPLQEQQRIVETTTHLLELCDQLESGLVEKQEAHEKMVKAMLVEV